MNNMKASGAIKIIALSNPILFDGSAWAKIGIRGSLKYLDDITQELIEHPAVYFVAYALGTFDLMIAVKFDSIDKLVPRNPYNYG